VLFKPKSVHMGAASLAASKPVFKSVLFVRIQHPGERDFNERPAKREDVERWPAAYQRYLEGRKQGPDGTPLAVLFPHHVDIIEMLAFHHVYTVEQLAELNDTQKQNIGMGGFEWSQKAARYLAAIEKGSGFAQHEETIQKLQVANTRKDESISALTQQVQQLTSQLAALMQGLNNQQSMGASPAMAAMPQAPTPFPLPQQGGMMQTAPGELGADDNVALPGSQAPGGVAAPAPDQFLDQVKAEASPADQPARRRRN